MSRHILVVEPDIAYAERFPDAPPETRWSIDCPEGNGCAGWIECNGDHKGYDPEDESSPAYDEFEDVEIHGVIHEYKWGYGWTVPYDGCVVQGQEIIDPPDELRRYDEDRGAWLLPLGRWIVDDDWDDTDCTLILVGPEGGDDRG